LATPPLAFEPNRGQTDSQAKFLVRGRGYTLFLTSDGAVLVLPTPADDDVEASTSGRDKTRGDKRKPKSGGRDSQENGSQPAPGPQSRSLIPEARIAGPQVLRLKLLGANPDAEISGADQLSGKVNYFRGSDPARWLTEIPTYARVRYANVYPGIDLVFYGNEGELQYDFVVAPGADPSLIRLEIETPRAALKTRNSRLETGNWKLENRKTKIETQDATRDNRQSAVINHSLLEVAPNGDLVIALPAGEVRMRKPFIYQPRLDGAREVVQGRFILRELGGESGNWKLETGEWSVVSGRSAAREDDGPRTRDNGQPGQSAILNPQFEISFELSAYDPTRPLVIDPVLTHSTYLGGGNADEARAVALDADGNIYLAGWTVSADFPVFPTDEGAEQPAQPSRAGGVDAFVTKLDPEATELIYSTYLGGADLDQALALAVDAAGSAYVAGRTRSTNFPTTSGVLQAAFAGGACGTQPCSDAFVAKLSANGSSLTYSTYLGGTGNDEARGLAIDASGNAYLVGTTASVNFPTVAAFQESLLGTSDAFVAKLNSSGSALTYSTFLGGGGADSGEAIALDAESRAVVAGHTNSIDFPTSSPFQAAFGGVTDAFVSKLGAAGDALVFSTYFGGSGVDRAFALALDAGGNVYLTGETNSTDFPFFPADAFQAALTGPSDAFVAKLNASASASVYATYLGGVDADLGRGIAVDAAGIATVTGATQSDDFPTLQPVQAVFGGGDCSGVPCPDAFVTRVNAAGTGLVSSTYLGGEHSDVGRAVRLDSAGNAYVAGSSASATFPATPGTFQFARAGTGPVPDAFLARLGVQDAPGVALAPQLLAFADQATGTTSDPQTVSLRNFGSEPLDVVDVTASSHFAVSHDCPASLDAGGAGCTLSVTFAPTEVAELTGEVTVVHTAAGSPAVVSLTGKGVTPTPAVTFSPASLEFEDTTVGSTSAPQMLTVTNSGSADLLISAITASTDFAQENTCPMEDQPLAPGGSCEITVTFVPASSGARTGTITVTSNAATSPNRANVSGTGVAVFSLTTTQDTVTIRRGAATATFTVSLEAPEDFTSEVTLNCTIPSPGTCAFEPASLARGGSSTLTVSGLDQLGPSSLDFRVNAVSGQQGTALNLHIIVEDFQIAVSPTFTTIAAGEAAKFTITVTPVNGFTGELTFTCFALPPESTCSFEPATVEITGTDPVTTEMTIQTTIRSGAPPPPASLPWLWLLAALGLAALAAAAPRARRRVPRFATALVVALVLTVSSCGTDFLPIRGTFSGTYQPVIEVKSGDAVHRAAVILTVT
jgi:hypothetical protein